MLSCSVSPASIMSISWQLSLLLSPTTRFSTVFQPTLVKTRYTSTIFSCFQQRLMLTLLFWSQGPVASPTCRTQAPLESPSPLASPGAQCPWACVRVDTDIAVHWSYMTGWPNPLAKFPEKERNDLQKVWG